MQSKGGPSQLCATIMALAMLTALGLGLGTPSGADQPAASMTSLELNLQKFQHYKSPFPGMPPAPSTPATSVAAVDACIQSGMAQYGVPGAAVAILDGGALVFEQGYGVKHQEQGGAVDPDTLFRFGSILKMMTSAAVMQQVEQGHVDLAAPVTSYIPEFQVASPWMSADITVLHLLTHSTGFPDRYDANLYSIFSGPTTASALSDWAAAQSAIPLFAPPGAFWNYSNPNFSLAGLVVRTLCRLCHRRIGDRRPRCL